MTETATILYRLDTLGDPVLGGVVRCVSALLGGTSTRVHLFDERHSALHLPDGLCAIQDPAQVPFCAITMLGSGVFEVPDAALDGLFADHPVVLSDEPVRFYAGVPLNIDGINVGTLCVVDRIPRQLEKRQRTVLRDMGAVIEHWMLSLRHKQTLRSIQRFVKHLSTAVPGMIFQYRREANGRVRMPFVSAGMASLFEQPNLASDCEPAVLAARVHRDDWIELLASIQDSGIRLIPWWHVFRVNLPLLGLRWLEGRATPERFEDGAVQWSGHMQDITERLAAEQAQREMQTAECANQARSAFVSRMSHELRTPLNAVLGFTQLIQAEASLSPRVQAYLTQVRKGGDHLLNLVSDILDLSRTEHGAANLRAEPVTLHAAVLTQMEQIEPLAMQRGVRLLPVRGDTSAMVLADERALGQVLLNLLSNAVKYNRENGTLTVEIGHREDCVTLSVSDQGHGLSPAQQQRLFRPFDRLGAEKSNTPGTGLGLVISKHLMEAMQGQLVAHAGLEGGCRFEPAGARAGGGLKQLAADLTSLQSAAAAATMMSLTNKILGLRKLPLAQLKYKVFPGMEAALASSTNSPSAKSFSTK
jgi:signal transduction histidine kinase